MSNIVSNLKQRIKRFQNDISILEKLIGLAIENRLDEDTLKQAFKLHIKIGESKAALLALQDFLSYVESQK